MCLSIAIQRPEAILHDEMYLGYQLQVIHNDLGYRCGYVRIPKGHPWHGKTTDWEEDWGKQDAPCVHGGITFAEADVPCDKGGADDAWWLGFDCAHCWDNPDPDLPHPEYGEKLHALMFNRTGGSIKTTEYVVEQCKGLIDQAVEVANG